MYGYNSFAEAQRELRYFRYCKEVGEEFITVALRKRNPELLVGFEKRLKDFDGNSFLETKHPTNLVRLPNGWIPFSFKDAENALHEMDGNLKKKMLKCGSKYFRRIENRHRSYLAYKRKRIEELNSLMEQLHDAKSVLVSALQSNDTFKLLKFYDDDELHSMEDIPAPSAADFTTSQCLRVYKQCLACNCFIGIKLQSIEDEIKYLKIQLAQDGDESDGDADADALRMRYFQCGPMIAKLRIDYFLLTAM